MEVTLSPEEVKIAEFVGKCKSKHSTTNGYRELKVSDYDSLELTIRGIAAEIAFCKLFNLYPDLSRWMRDFDAISADGLTYDVKNSESGEYMIINMSKKDKPCDFYVLMGGSTPTFRYRGKIPKEFVFQPENIKDPGNRNKPCYFIKAIQLEQAAI